MSSLWELLRRLTEPSPEVGTPPERRQARTIAALFLAMPFVAIAAVAVQGWVDPALRTAWQPLAPWLLPMPVGYVLARSRWYVAAIGLFVALPVAATTHAILNFPGDPLLFIYLLVPVALAGGLLDGRRAAMLGAVVIVVAGLLGAYVAPVLGPAQMVRTAVAFGFMMFVLLAAQAHLVAIEAERRADLAHREALSRRVLEASFGGIAVVRDGVIRDANDGFARLFGSDVVGHRVAEYLPDVALDPAAGRTPPVETTGRRSDGTFVHVALVTRPDSSPSGVEHVVAVGDLSERDALRARLHQVDRMAAMGQLAAGVAHEINNPLTWVISNLERLAADLDGDLRDAAQQAADGARRVRRIARDLETFARAAPGPVVAVDLDRVARSAVSLVRHDLEHHARLDEDYGPAPSIDGDPTRVGQVCMALLVNAAQAVAGLPDRTVRVRVGTDPLGRALFSVEDDGPGIPADIQGRVFEPFFTTRQEGTGLGLAISKSLVAEMGGEMFLDSRPGEGTRIGFHVRPGQLVPGPGNDDDTEEEHAAPRSAKVLIIDDEPAICELLQSALPDHQVTVASNGEEGRRLALESAWDVILCDLMMPGVSGMDIHDALAREAPGRERRMVFLTGGAFTSATRSFLDRTHNAVMFKPFRISRIRDAVAQAIPRE